MTLDESYKPDFTVSTAHRGSIYQIKANHNPYQMLKK